jgi:hypothetical protein
MEETPAGTPVGVDDPYDHAGRCDHMTEDGRCRFAVDHATKDPDFAAARRAEDLLCPVAADEWDASECPHFRFTTEGQECLRCGLSERRDAHSDSRPLIEEHHLSYGAAGETTHEITVSLCRWCHAKVHGSIARIGDDVNPDPEATAERESRRSEELSELDFETAAERTDCED